MLQRLRKLWKAGHFLRCCRFRFHNVQVRDRIIPKHLRCFASMSCPVLRRKDATADLLGPPSVSRLTTSSNSSGIYFTFRLFFFVLIKVWPLASLVIWYNQRIFWDLVRRSQACKTFARQAYQGLCYAKHLIIMHNITEVFVCNIKVFVIFFYFPKILMPFRILMITIS